MKKLDMVYEGKAKKVFKTDDENVFIVDYKDDATAFNGVKKGTIVGKGVINNRMTNYLFQKLEEVGVPTHYVKELSDRETAVKKVDIVPLEVRRQRQMCIRDRINDYFAIAIGAATREDIDTITKYAFMVNDFLKKFFDDCGIDLIDFKIEFGKTSDGTIILADEISPDTCRFWDKKTHEKLDKDRFRRDLGGVEDAYQEVAKRIGLI